MWAQQLHSLDQQTFIIYKVGGKSWHLGGWVLSAISLVGLRSARLVGQITRMDSSPHHPSYTHLLIRLKMSKRGPIIK